MQKTPAAGSVTRYYDSNTRRFLLVGGGDLPVFIIMGAESPEQRKSNFLCCSFRRLNRAIKKHEKQLSAMQLVSAGAAPRPREAETRRKFVQTVEDALRGGEVLPGAEAVLGGGRGGGAGGKKNSD